MKPHKHTLCALALVGAIAAFYVLTIREGHVWGDDHAAYIAHAKNIADGKPYGDIGYVRSPSSINPSMYPPGFPLLLAPVYQWCGLSLTPMKIMCIGFFCVALLLLYFLVRGYGEGVALATLAVIGLCPYFWDFKDTIYSEYAFLPFVYAGLLAGKTAARRDADWVQQFLMGMAAGVLAGMAYATRSVAVVLIPAILLHHFLVTRKITWFAGNFLGCFVLIAVAQNRLFQLQSDYLTPLLQVLSVGSLLASPLYYMRCLAVPWDNGYSEAAQAALYIALGAFALYGVWTRFQRPSADAWEPSVGTATRAPRPLMKHIRLVLRAHRSRPLDSSQPVVGRSTTPSPPDPRPSDVEQIKPSPVAASHAFEPGDPNPVRPNTTGVAKRQFETAGCWWQRLTLVDIFAVFYFLFIVFFPWGGRRYLMPIMPVFVLYALVGVREWALRRPNRRRLALQIGVASAIALTFALKYTTLPWRDIPGGIRTPGFSELVGYLKANVDPDDTVIFFKARLGALYFGAKVVGVYADPDLGRVLQYYRKLGVSHLVAQKASDDPADTYLRDLASRLPEHFALQHEVGAFEVFRFDTQALP